MHIQKYRERLALLERQASDSRAMVDSASAYEGEIALLKEVISDFQQADEGYMSVALADDRIKKVQGEVIKDLEATTANLRTALTHLSVMPSSIDKVELLNIVASARALAKTAIAEPKTGGPMPRPVDVDATLRSIAAEVLCLEESTLMDNMNVDYSALGADSLDIVEMIITVEEEFDIELRDEDVDSLNTLRSLSDLVKASLEKGKAA